jgi:hypothetical protein
MEVMMFDKTSFGEMPYEHFPEGMKLPKLPLPSELRKAMKEAEQEHATEPKAPERQIKQWKR